MSRLHQLIIFFNYFSLGIVVPILNLILLERGASLQTLPLLLGIYSITILCLELPSGVCADIYGRKKTFLLSTAFIFISFTLIFMADTLVWLIVAMIINGMGRAFSSGSLDALFIDQAILRKGEGCLTGVTTRMSIIESSGLAVGAIAGGAIANATDTYLINIGLRLVLTAILFTLCLAFIKENPSEGKKQRTTLTEHLREGKKVLGGRPELSLVFIGIFFLGFFLCTIEVYWQPAFMDISNSENSKLMLGIITFIGFFAAPFGNLLAKKALDRNDNKWWQIYTICRILFALCIIIFAFQKNSVSFVIFYAFIYLMLGSSNLAELTLIHKFTPSSMRASMLSLSSLLMQIGFLSASIFSSIMILKLQFTGLWIVAGMLLGGYALVASVVIKQKNRKSVSANNLKCDI